MNVKGYNSSNDGGETHNSHKLSDFRAYRRDFLYTCVSTHSTEPSGNLVGGSLHDADQRRDETHLHGSLAALDLSQLLEDVLGQRRHHGV